jgi:hypothetical protein
MARDSFPRSQPTQYMSSNGNGGVCACVPPDAAVFVWSHHLGSHLGHVVSEEVMSYPRSRCPFLPGQAACDSVTHWVDRPISDWFFVFVWRWASRMSAETRHSCRLPTVVYLP